MNSYYSKSFSELSILMLHFHISVNGPGKKVLQKMYMYSSIDGAYVYFDKIDRPYRRLARKWHNVS